MIARARKKNKIGPMPESRLGLKMRHTRLLKGLTLKKVAELAECWESVLYRIETETRTHRSRRCTASHWRSKCLYRGCFRTVATMIHENVMLCQGERPTVQAGQRKGHRLEALIPSRRGNLLSGYINDIEPGSGSEGVITHEGEEFGYVLDGELELTVDKKKYQLRPGDSFYFRSERPHSYINNRKKLARILWLNTPPTFKTR